MATPSAMAFHEDSRRLYRGIAMNSVKYYEGRNQRRIDPTYKGMIKNSTGSWNTPFVGSQDESMKPFNPMPGAKMGSGMMRGGIRNNANYPKVKELLQQRARDMDIQDNPTIVPPIPIESITEEDKYKIKLNSLLLRANDMFETGEQGMIADDIWREILVLVANIAPTASMEELNDLVDYFDNTLLSASFDVFEKGEAKKQLQKGVFTRYRLLSAISDFIKQMIVRFNDSEANKRLFARSYLRKMGIVGGYASKILKEADEYFKEYQEDLMAKTRKQPIIPEGFYEDLADYDAPLEDEEEEEEELEEGEQEEQSMGAPSTAPTLPSVATRADPNEISKAERRFMFLYGRSPTGASNASDALMSLFYIVRPKAQLARSRTQVKNAVVPRLDETTRIGNVLRERLRELVPQIA